MPFLLSADPWPLCVIAVAGIGMGLYGLLTGSRKNTRPTWRGPALLAALLTLVGAGAFVAEWPALVWQPALVLAGVWLAFALVRLCFLRSAARMLMVLRHPKMQSGALCLGSGLLLAWQVDHINREEAEELDHSEALLTKGFQKPDLVPLEHALARTDTGTPVSLYKVRPGSTPSNGPGTTESCDSQLLTGRKLVQTNPPSGDYNCHGWVFTGGRCWVLGESVEQILKDNGYHEVSTPVPGDLAVFRDQKGEVTHTAVVHSFGADGDVLLESKWGQLGRYIHSCADHIYANNTFNYYRSSRTGHLLRGVDSIQPEDTSVAAKAKDPAVAEIEGRVASAGNAKPDRCSPCCKPHTRMQWQQWALWRQRQAQLAGHRFSHPEVANHLAARNRAASPKSGRRFFVPPPMTRPANRAASPKTDGEHACGQWDYWKQI